MKKKRLSSQEVSKPFLLLFCACFLLYFGGVLLLYLGTSEHGPFQFSHRIYLSENALSPFSASVGYSTEDLKFAAFTSIEYSVFQKELNQNKLSRAEWSSRTADWICDKLRGLGLNMDTEKTSFGHDSGQNTYLITSVLHPLRATNTESILLGVKYHRTSVKERVITDLGLGISLLRYFSRSNWLAKDVILLVSENFESDVEKLIQLRALDFWVGNYMSEPHAGVIEAALHLQVSNNTFHRLHISSDSGSAFLPNLDLVNMITFVANYRTSTPVSIASNSPHAAQLKLQNSSCGGSGRFFSLIDFMLTQAFAPSISAHSIFNAYSIHSVTLIAENHGSQAKLHGSANCKFKELSILELGKTVEAVVRSLSNLLERFHQSFYFYLRPSTFEYIAIGDYYIFFAPVFLPLVFETLRFASRTSNFNIIRAIAVLLPLWIIAVCFCASLLITPPEKLQDILPWALFILMVTCSACFGCYGGFSKSVTRFVCPGCDLCWWSPFKTAVTIPLVLFLTCFSLVNFSFSFVVSCLIIPLYTYLYPSRYSTVQNVAGLVVSVLLSPIIVLVFMKLVFRIDFLEHSIISFHLLGSLTFPFLCLVYFPYNCAHILLFAYSIFFKNSLPLSS